MRTESPTLMENPNNYIDHENMRDVLNVVIECTQHTFGKPGMMAINSCSLSDIIIMRNEYRNIARHEPEVRDIFIKYGMSLFS